MKNFLILCLTILTLSCSSIKVFSDFDNSINFDNYKSFAFFKPGIEEVEISDLDKRRIKLSVKAAQIDEEKSLVAKFGEGATKSGATLKGIFEKALGRKSTKKKDK